MANGDPIKRLYDQVSEHADIGPWEGFAEALGKEDSRRKFFDGVNPIVDLGEYTQFESDVLSALDERAKKKDSTVSSQEPGGLPETDSAPTLSPENAELDNKALLRLVDLNDYSIREFSPSQLRDIRDKTAVQLTGRGYDQLNPQEQSDLNHKMMQVAQKNYVDEANWESYAKEAGIDPQTPYANSGLMSKQWWKSGFNEFAGSAANIYGDAIRGAGQLMSGAQSMEDAEEFHSKHSPPAVYEPTIELMDFIIGGDIETPGDIREKLGNIRRYAHKEFVAASRNLRDQGVIGKDGLNDDAVMKSMTSIAKSLDSGDTLQDIFKTTKDPVTKDIAAFAAMQWAYPKKTKEMINLRDNWDSDEEQNAARQIYDLVRDQNNFLKIQKIKENPATKIGDDIKDWTGENFPINPRIREKGGVTGFTASVLPQAFGSALAFTTAEIPSMMRLLPPGMASGTLGALSTAATEFDQAYQATGDVDTAYDAWERGMLIGPSEGAPIGGLIMRMRKLRGFQNAAKKTLGARAMGALRQGGEEAVQEFASGIALNWSAQDLYDESRNILDGTFEQGLAGFVVGAFMGGITARLDSSKLSKKERQLLEGARENIADRAREELVNRREEIRNKRASGEALSMNELAEEQAISEALASMEESLGEIAEQEAETTQEDIAPEPEIPASENVQAAEALVEEFRQKEEELTSIPGLEDRGAAGTMEAEGMTEAEFVERANNDRIGELETRLADQTISEDERARYQDELIRRQSAAEGFAEMRGEAVGATEVTAETTQEAQPEIELTTYEAEGIEPETAQAEAVVQEEVVQNDLEKGPQDGDSFVSEGMGGQNEVVRENGKWGYKSKITGDFNSFPARAQEQITVEWAQYHREKQGDEIAQEERVPTTPSTVDEIVENIEMGEGIEPNQYERGKARVAQGFSDLMSHFGLQENITGEERPKLTNALREIVGGLMDMTGAKFSDAWNMAKEKFAEAGGDPEIIEELRQEVENAQESTPSPGAPSEEKGSGRGKKERIRVRDTGKAEEKQQETEAPEPPRVDDQEVDTPKGRKKAFLNRVMNDPNISEEVKSKVKARGLEYLTVARDINASEARAIIDSYGIENAVDLALGRMREESVDLAPRIKVAILQQAIAHMTQQIDSGNLSKKQREAMINLQTDVMYRTDMLLREYGRAIKEADYGIARAIEAASPDAVLRFIMRRQRKARDKAMGAAAEDVAADWDSFMEAAGPAIKKAVKAVLREYGLKANQKRRKRGESAISALERLKLGGKGAAYDATIGLLIAVWDQAITTIQTAIKAGAAVADAIEAGVKYINRTHGMKWDEGGFRAKMNDVLGEYDAEARDKDSAQMELEVKSELEDLLDGEIRRIKSEISALDQKAKEDLSKAKDYETKKAIREKVKEDKADLQSELKKRRADSRKQLEEIATSHITSQEGFAQSMAQRIVKEMGAEPEVAQELEQAVRRELEKELKKQKDKVLSRYKPKTVAGRKKKEVFDRAVEAMNAGALTSEVWNDIHGEIFGVQELSPRRQAEIRDLTARVQEVLQAKKKADRLYREALNLEGGERKAKVREAVQAAREWKERQGEAEKAHRRLSEYINGPRTLVDTLITVMQGNLLTPATQMVNILGNLMFLPLRFGTKLVGAAAENIHWAVGGPRPSKHPLTAQLAYWRGGWKGFKDGTRQLFTGVGGADIAKGEVVRGLNPSALWKRLYSYVSKSYEYDSLDTWYNDAIMGTIGYPAEIMFRFLNLGDKMFRGGAEYMKLMEIAKERGLKGLEKELAMFAPDEPMARRAEEAGREATYQQDNQMVQTSQKLVKAFIGWQSQFLGDVVSQRVAKVAEGVLVLLGKFNFPYVKIPMNIFLESMEYILPELSMARAIFHANEYRKSKDIESRDRATELFGKAVVGFTLNAGFTALAAAGIISGEEDDEKGRAARYTMGMAPYSINLSALSRLLAGQDPGIRSGDFTINYQKWGILGMMMGSRANLDRWERKRKREGKDAGVLGKMWTRSMGVASLALDQTMMSGASNVLEALNKGDFSKILQGYARTASATFTTNTLGNLIRSKREYMIDRKSTEAKEFEGMMKERFQANPDLPKKYDMWGNLIPETPKGQNALWYHLFSPTKGRWVTSDDLMIGLWDLYEESGYEKGVFPSQPKQSIEGVELTKAEYKEFVKLVGDKRRIYARMVFTEPIPPGEIREDYLVEQLKKAYNSGLRDAKEEFKAYNPGFTEKYYQQKFQ